METKNTSITFSMGLRGAQSLLMLMRLVDKKPRYSSINMHNFIEGNFKDFSDTRDELERLLMMSKT